MKKILAFTLAIITILAALCLSGCGETYVCYKCDKETSTAYYTMTANKDRVLCEDCARKYWLPHNYENYEVE